MSNPYQIAHLPSLIHDDEPCRWVKMHSDRAPLFCFPPLNFWPGRVRSGHCRRSGDPSRLSNSGKRKLTESARDFPKASGWLSPNGPLREARTRPRPARPPLMQAAWESPYCAHPTRATDLTHPPRGYQSLHCPGGRALGEHRRLPECLPPLQPRASAEGVSHCAHAASTQPFTSPHQTKG